MVRKDYVSRLRIVDENLQRLRDSITEIYNGVNSYMEGSDCDHSVLSKKRREANGSYSKIWRNAPQRYAVTHLLSSSCVFLARSGAVIRKIRKKKPLEIVKKAMTKPGLLDAMFSAFPEEHTWEAEYPKAMELLYRFQNGIVSDLEREEARLVSEALEYANSSC